MQTTTGQRTSDGRFARGNPGGPGRPRRLIEADYLKALSDAVTPEDWRAIVRAAVDAAKSGDARARDWLCRYLLGEKPPTLLDLAADDAAGLGTDALLVHRISERQQDRDCEQSCNPWELREALQILERLNPLPDAPPG